MDLTFVRIDNEEEHERLMRLVNAGPDHGEGWEEWVGFPVREIEDGTLVDGYKTEASVSDEILSIDEFEEIV